MASKASRIRKRFERLAEQEAQAVLPDELRADNEPDTHPDTESTSEASEPASQASSATASLLSVLDAITPRLDELSATIARIVERLERLEQSQATATSLPARRERGRGTWLYLRESVIAELQRIAQERGVSVSQVANELLTRALGLR